MFVSVNLPTYFYKEPFIHHLYIVHGTLYILSFNVHAHGRVRDVRDRDVHARDVHGYAHVLQKQF